MTSGDFSVFLRDLLASRHISITAWARRISISQGYASNLCTSRRNPPLDQIDAWATDLGLSQSERRQFWVLAILTHLPEVAWPRLQEMLSSDLQLVVPSPGHKSETLDLSASGSRAPAI